MPGDEHGDHRDGDTNAAATSAGGEAADGASSVGSPSTRSGPDPGSRRELLDRARSYARRVVRDSELDLDLDGIEWEISERATRRAGACRYDEETGTVTIRLTWRAFDEHGWDEMARTVRHELVHAWEYGRFGEAGHGRRFREMADELDAPRHCREFVEPRLRLVCRRDGCDWSAGRHRASKTVSRPERRRCGECGGEYVVRHVGSGEAWTTNAGYRAARERLGTEW